MRASQLYAVALVAMALTLSGCKGSGSVSAGPAAPADPISTAATPPTSGPAAPGSTLGIASPTATNLSAAKPEPSVNLGASGERLEAIMLTATWCHYCQVMKQGAWPAAKSRYPGVAFRLVDVDGQKAEAQALGEGPLPTFIFRKGGREVSRFSGASPEKLDSSLASLSRPL